MSEAFGDPDFIAKAVLSALEMELFADEIAEEQDGEKMKQDKKSSKKKASFVDDEPAEEDHDPIYHSIEDLQAVDDASLVRWVAKDKVVKNVLHATAAAKGPLHE